MKQTTPLTVIIRDKVKDYLRVHGNNFLPSPPGCVSMEYHTYDQIVGFMYDDNETRQARTSVGAELYRNT